MKDHSSFFFCYNYVTTFPYLLLSFFLCAITSVDLKPMSEIGSRLNIICLETEAFYALVDEVVDHVQEQLQTPQERWIDDIEAMSMLKINSKTTLQKYRDEGVIRYSQPSKKVILYDRESILAFLEKHAKDTF